MILLMKRATSSLLYRASGFGTRRSIFDLLGMSLFRLRTIHFSDPGDAIAPFESLPRM
jgi:hypothetical protein